MLSCTYSTTPTVSRITITGYVLDERDSTGLDSVQVRMLGNAAGTTTDTNGYFSLPCRSTADSVLLHVERIRYASRIVAVPVGPDGNGDISQIIALLRDYAVITGYVWSLPDTLAVFSARMRVISRDGTAFDSAFSVAGGMFSLTCVTEDSCEALVVADMHGFAPDTLCDTIAAGDSLAINMFLRPYIQLTGVVADSATQMPLEGVSVTVSENTVFSATDGTFSFSALLPPDTGIIMQVWGQFHSPRVLRFAAMHSDANVGTILLSRGRGSLHASLQVQGRSDHCGAYLHVPSLGLSDTASVSGMVTFDSVAAGRWPIVVGHNSCRTQTDSLTVLPNDTAYATWALAIETDTITEDVVWNSEINPYHIRDTLTIHGAATLTMKPGVSVVLDSGACVRLSGDGYLQANGSRRQPVRISSAPEGNISAALLLRGTGTENVLRYTIVENVRIGIHGGARFENCVFSHVGHTCDSALVRVDADEYAAYFKQCDFIWYNSSSPAVALDGNPALAAVHFIATSFYRIQSGSPCANFLAAPLSPGLTVQVSNSNFYSECTLAQPLLSLAQADTSNVSSFDPGYVDISTGDYHLTTQSPLLSIAGNEEVPGAFGSVDTSDAL